MTPTRALVFILAALALLGIGLLFLLMRPASAHDIFTNLHDPVDKGLCCTGPSDPDPDCRQVPAEWVPSVIQEVPGVGWRVRLTLGQAKFFNSASNFPIDNVVTYDRLISGLASGWGICVYAGKIRCLIGPSNS